MTHLLSKLTKLKIDDCGSLGDLSGEFQASPPLKYLSITNCKNLAFIPSGLQRCTALEELLMDKCDELMSITVDDGVGGGVNGEWQSLRYLEIRDCKKLVSIPSGLRCCPDLEKLIIYGCNQLISIGVRSGKEWQSLRYLEIGYCESLVSIPSGLQCCTALEKMIIHDCKELTSIIVNVDDGGGFGRYCQSLREVEISKCSKLKHLPIRGFLSCASLENLKITWCNGLISIDDGDLKPTINRDECGNPVHDGSSLVVLSIYQCPSLGDFPRDIFSCLTQLKQLIIGPFSKKLEAFPEGILHSIHHSRGSLRELRIIGWDKVKSLPHQLQHLTALEKLSIKKFPGEDCFHLTLPKKLENGISLEELQVFSAGIVNPLDLDEGLKSLPNELQDLNALQKLRTEKFPGEDIFHHTLLKKSEKGSSSEKLEVVLNFLKLDIVLKSLPYQLRGFKKLRIEKSPGKDSFHLTLLTKSKEDCSSKELVVFPTNIQNSLALDIVLEGPSYQLQNLIVRSKWGTLKFKKIEKALPDWLGNLSSLQELEIRDCKDVKHLPSSKAMQHLSALKRLDIQGCPCLSKSLSKDCDEHHGVTERAKISHLP